MNVPSVFVTGASGFLGSHFVLELARARPSRVAALVRGADDGERRSKLLRALSTAGAAYRPARLPEPVLDATHVVAGDIELTRCGVEPTAVAHLAAEGIDEVWHFASSLAFEERRRSTIEAQNIGGVRNVIELAAALGAKRFIYVSTAYTAGIREGAIEPVLHPVDSAFGNVYEESKCRAEHLATELCRHHGIALTILRPSIVIGCSQTRRCAGSKTGLYGFMREVALLGPTLAACPVMVHIGGNIDAELNLIPVDWVMDDIRRLIESNFGGPSIVHITSDTSVTLARALALLCEKLDIGNLTLTADEPDAGRSPVERLLAKRTSFYRSYMLSAKSFVRERGRRRGVTEEDLVGYYVEALREMRGEAVEQALARSVVTAADGVALTVYERGRADAPPLLVVNAVGMPVELVAPLMERLASEHRVVTWECRALPGEAATFDGMAVDIGVHVKDALAVAAAKGIDAFDALGWCSGAVLALHLARSTDRVLSVTLLNGSYELDDAPRTLFESNMRSVMPRIASGRAVAQTFHRALFQRADTVSEGDLETRRAQTLSNGVLSATDPDLLHLTSTPFQSAESLYRYAHLTEAFWKDDCAAWAASVSCPALVCTGARDVTAHPERSRRIAGLLPNARLHDSGGDHFDVYRSSELSGVVLAFLAARPAPARTSSEFEARVARIVSRFTGSELVSTQASLRGDLSIDSLSLMTLVISVESEFGVDFIKSGVDLGMLRTVGDLATTARQLTLNGE